MLALIAGLVVLLILAVLYRDEIREAISIGVLLFAGYAFWTYEAWWAKAIGGALYATAAMGIVGLIVGGGRGRGVQARAEAQQVVAASPPSPPPSAPVVWEDAWWWRDGRGVEHGPVSEEQLLALLRERRLPPDTLIRWGRQGEWQPANRLWAARF